MKSMFTIDGMTCSGCAAKVTYTLQQIDSVSEVAVDLDAKQATLTAERSIDLAEVASELAPHPKYSVNASTSNAATSGLKPIHWRTYWPLILIGLFISVVSTGITWQTTGP